MERNSSYIARIPIVLLLVPKRTVGKGSFSDPFVHENLSSYAKIVEIFIEAAKWIKKRPTYILGRTGSTSYKSGDI